MRLFGIFHLRYLSNRMLTAIFLLGALSFIISWLATAAMIRVAPRIGFVDKPGHRKIHQNPKPLGGGIAILLAFVGPLLVGLLALNFVGDGIVSARINPQLAAALLGGVKQQTPMALTFLAGCVVLHILGLLDDRRALGPYVKLIVQLAVSAALVIFFSDVRALTVLTPIPSIILTILWITAITNAFNFLDNMDGLSAGVAAVTATAFLVTTLIMQQWFVVATLAVLLGALLGFLYWNFSPAKIFMGDSGSLVVGFVLGVLTIRTTYLPPGAPTGTIDLGARWYAVLAPVIVLALPLYDLIVVSILRISRGKSPFVGDTNHLSHRLVARGMSRRTAVLCIYLMTAATASAAIVLPQVRTALAAILLFLQTLLVLGVVALLEQHPLPSPRDDEKPGV